jgi:hypothetical protein
MTGRARLLTLALVAVAACPALAATAAAEVRTGEYNAPVNAGVEPEVDATNVKVSYESSTGAVNWAITTAAPPSAGTGWEAKAWLFTVTGTCDVTAITPGGFAFPFFEIAASYEESKAEAILLSSGGSEAPLGPATYSLTAATTNLSATYHVIANYGFNCAELSLGGGSPLYFPVKGPVSPPAPPPPTPSTQGSGSQPAPASPAKLAIAKPKPVGAAVGKWKTVNLKVTNTGGTGTAQGSLRVATVAGVNVKPAKQKLPALAPGASWTLSVRVQVTSQAKQKSTLSITAGASGLTAKSSLVVKSTD